MAREGYAVVSLKPAYADKIKQFRENQLVDPGNTEVVYAALDMFFKEHGIEPPDE